jgi:phospholipid/cholesterol/gamma-HCH transport system permease protein
MIRPRNSGPRFVPALTRQLDELFWYGLPLVALVHVPTGSFLAMQAFYHATFTDAVGAVVGLGLLRNMAPMLTGLVLAGFCAIRITPELRGGLAPGIDYEPEWAPNRDQSRGEESDSLGSADAAQVTAVRLAAAIIAGPILALWGTAIGTLVGMALAASMLGVSPAIYIGKILELVQPIDVAGLVVKGAAFAALAALFACHEGLGVGRHRDAVRSATFRATCCAMMAILAANSCWFTLAYLSGAPFGPALASR